MAPIDEIKSVLRQHPNLTVNGFCERDDAGRREEIVHPKTIEQFARAKAWLSDRPRTKAVNRSRTSYSWKHDAERDIGYLPNGVFIAAAIAAGLAVQRAHDGPNAWINLSAR